MSNTSSDLPLRPGTKEYVLANLESVRQYRCLLSDDASWLICILIEERQRLLEALSRREFADKFDAPHDEALRSVIPTKYLGWSLKEAAAEYIKELKEALRMA